MTDIITGPHKGRQIAARDAAKKREANKLVPTGAFDSRQFARAAHRRAAKMPIGASQEAWHLLHGFGKIGTGKRPKVSA